MATDLRRRFSHLLRSQPPATGAGDAPGVTVRGAEGTRVPWPAYPPKAYLGQLTPEHQAAMAAARSWITRADCDFYHATTLPSGEVLPGAWDLRDHEAEYLGGVSFSGDRVLELGPASGHLSRYLEQQSREVVSFDVGWDRTVDLLPQGGVSDTETAMALMAHIGKVQNAWWYLAAQFGSRVTKVYGDIYHLPGDIGTFDTSVFAAILLHLRNPFDALMQAADHTAQRIVITEPWQDEGLDPDAKLMRFAPFGAEARGNWWLFTPAMLTGMLEYAGFPNVTLTWHTQLHHLGHDLSKPAASLKMFTLVGTRT